MKDAPISFVAAVTMEDLDGTGRRTCMMMPCKAIPVDLKKW
jgi:hypothetical protein